AWHPRRSTGERRYDALDARYVAGRLDLGGIRHWRRPDADGGAGRAARRKRPRRPGRQSLSEARRARVECRTRRAGRADRRCAGQPGRDTVRRKTHSRVAGGGVTRRYIAATLSVSAAALAISA